MSGFNAKERNKYGEYEITFYTENRQDFKKVQDLCRNLIGHGKPVSTEGDLISREALKKYARVVFDKDLGRLRVVDVSDIDNAPTVEPVKQCKYCKHCGNEDYCSNCHSDHSLFEYYERPQSDMLPVGTTIKIKPEDIKWDSEDLISRKDLRNVILNDSKLDGVDANWEVNRILVHIENAPTASDRYYEGYAQGYIHGSTGADWQGE